MADKTYKQKHLEYKRRRRTERPDDDRRYRAMHKYGLSLEEYDDLLSKPCAVCGGEATHLDHDHKTGRVRKALCLRCNTGLGKLDDDPLRLLKAMRYLMEHES